MAVCVVGSFTTLFSKMERLYGVFVWVYTLDSLLLNKKENVGDKRQEPLVLFWHWCRAVSTFINHLNAVICTKTA